MNAALAERMKGDKPKDDPPQWYATSLLKEFEELTENGYFDEAPKAGKSFLGIPIPFTGAEAKYDREKSKKDPVYALQHREDDEAAWARSKMAQELDA